MSYNYLTFNGARIQAAQRLSDERMVFWSKDELGIYINAALREFNAISRIFRDRGTFNTAASATFYDLTAVLKNGAGNPFLSPTITDAQLLEQAKLMLIEPNPGDNASFTDGFTLSTFTDSFTQRRNQFLLETGIYVSQPTPQVVPAGTDRVTFTDDTIIDVRRATWTDLSGNVTQLTREDEFSSFSFSPSWVQDTGVPQRYSIFPDPLLTIQLIPPPNDNGTLTIQSISSGVVPDDFTPAILWGALADLVGSPGPGYDPLRAAYAEQRFQEYLVVGRQFVTVQQAYLNGVPAATQAIYDADMFEPDWQTPSVPSSVLLVGANLLATAPVANGIYGVVIDAVSNAPQLTADSDPFPLGREYLDDFLDYVTHLAIFKQGGAELQQSLPMYDSFVKTAIAYNNRMSAQNLNFDTLVDKAAQEENQQALRKEVAA